MFGFSDVQCGHCHKKLMKKKECGCFEEGNVTKEKELTILQKIHLYHRKMNEISYKFEMLVLACMKCARDIPKGKFSH